jgi:hypothetical protein
MFAFMWWKVKKFSWSPCHDTHIKVTKSSQLIQWLLLGGGKLTAGHDRIISLSFLINQGTVEYFLGYRVHMVGYVRFEAFKANKYGKIFSGDPLCRF